MILELVIQGEVRKRKIGYINACIHNLENGPLNLSAGSGIEMQM